MATNPEQAQMAWDEWIVPFFKTIDDNPDVVKAINYINCDSHPIWFDNLTFKKIDARLHENDTISNRWKEITSKAKYIKPSEGLYSSMYHND